MIDVDQVFGTEDQHNAGNFTSLSISRYYGAGKVAVCQLKYFGNDREDLIVHIKKHMLYAAKRFTVPVRMCLYNKYFSNSHDGVYSDDSCFDGITGVRRVDGSPNHYVLMTENLSDEEFEQEVNMSFQKYDVCVFDD